MRISRRTSGGRGEYEISENSPEGLTPADLFDHRLILDFGGGWVVDTQTVLTRQGGKRRIRLIDKSKGIHVQRQVATGLMLPHPMREDKTLGRGLPIAKANQYAIDHIQLGKVRTAGNVAHLEVTSLVLRNISHHAEELHTADRREKVGLVWRGAGKLPDEIAALLRRHKALVSTGGPIGKDAEAVVVALQQQLTDAARDLGLIYRSSGEDALPDLLRAIQYSEEPPAPPIAVDQVDPDDTEIKRRTVKEWKQWASVRGAASVKFRQEVRRVYNSTCVVCGLHLPPTSDTKPGVDAAHILPWADYDLDEVSNGICLCKTHHWAFDEGLIVITAVADGYLLEIPGDVKASLLAQAPAFSLEALERHAGRIPEARLPRKVKDRPRALFLKKLRESS